VRGVGHLGQERPGQSDAVPRRLAGCGKRAAGRLARAAVLILLLPSLALPAEVFFSPKGAARQRLIQAIQDSRSTVDVAVYNFTSAELAEALFKARGRGVRVRVVLDRERYEEGGATIQALKKSDMPVRAWGIVGQSLMHHKFAIFDGKLVATGSYNWTNAAERVNRENIVLLDDPHVLERFEREFARLWRQAAVARR
jgi:phosphatidylserine/phosphatidylglycerophosphate/cardiolipin synthase-like enzyme